MGDIFKQLRDIDSTLTLLSDQLEVLKDISSDHFEIIFLDSRIKTFDKFRSELNMLIKAGEHHA